MTAHDDRKRMTPSRRGDGPRRSGVRLALVVTLTLVGGGCGYRRPALVPVAGAVDLDGQPVAAASLVFIPEAGGRPATATTDEHGRFQVSTFGRSDGLVRGTYRVVVTKPVLRPVAAKRLRRPAATSDGEPARVDEDFTDGDYANLLPARYAEAETSGIEVRIDGSRQPLRIALEGAPQRPLR